MSKSSKESAKKKVSARRSAFERASRATGNPEGCGAVPAGELPLRHVRAAGIDIGSREHWVAVGEGAEEVRRFGSFTPELNEMVEWLQKHQVTDVAMESTSVYWIPVFEKLEAAGLRVILVDARQTKHVSGRKSDLRDCQWIWQLHRYGLLRAAFRPHDEICRLRTLQRHYKTLVEMAAKHMLHVQKALDGMNLHLHHVLSDLSGQSAQAMIAAILAGERDPKALARLADRRVKKPAAEIEAALTGNYRGEELFVLEQAQGSYEYCQQQLAKCALRIEEQIVQMNPASVPAEERPSSGEPQQAEESQTAEKRAASAPRSKRAALQAREATQREQLRRILGVDLTAIPGLGILAVITLLSEIGTDMSKWRNSRAFASWLGLCPNHRISGGNILSARSRKVVNRAATILRMAALVVGRTDSPLGLFYRRKKTQLGAPKAVTATARKIACLVYEMISTRTEYRKIEAEAYQEKYDRQRIEALRKRANKLGYDMVELPGAA